MKLLMLVHLKMLVKRMMIMIGMMEEEDLSYAKDFLILARAMGVCGRTPPDYGGVEGRDGCLEDPFPHLEDKGLEPLPSATDMRPISSFLPEHCPALECSSWQAEEWLFC